MSQEWKWDSGTFKGSSNHCSCLSQGLKAELWGEPSSTRPSAPHHISCETKVLMSSRLSRASLCFSVSSSVGPWCWIREQLTSLLNLKEGKTCFTVSSSRGEENRFVIITQRLCENSSKELNTEAMLRQSGYRLLLSQRSVRYQRMGYCCSFDRRQVQHVSSWLLLRRMKEIRWLQCLCELWSALADPSGAFVTFCVWRWQNNCELRSRSRCM